MSRARQAAEPKGQKPAAAKKPRSGSSTRKPPADAAAPTPEPPRTDPPAREQRTNGDTGITVDAGVVRGLARSASRIVSQAATILEEEFAAGIGAAKQIETRFLDVAEMRSANADEVMTRFRKDAHEVVDIALDLLSASTRSLGGLAQRISVGDTAARDAEGEAPASPTIVLPGDLHAGGSGSVPLALENDADAPTAEFAFQATDLVNADGDAIPASRVRFAPEKLVIGARDRVNVDITVQVPKGTPAGVYTGLVLASKLERVRAVLVVTVV